MERSWAAESKYTLVALVVLARQASKKKVKDTEAGRRELERAVSTSR